MQRGDRCLELLFASGVDQLEADGGNCQVKRRGARGLLPLKRPRSKNLGYPKHHLAREKRSAVKSVTALILLALATTAFSQSAADMVETSGVKGGLVVYIGSLL